MQSTIPHLRPMDLGDILDTVFRLYRNNFLTFIGIVAIIQIPIILVQFALTLLFNQGVTADLMGLMQRIPDFDPRYDSFQDLPITNLASFLVSLILFGIIQGIIAQQLINGALSYAISQRYHFRPVSILSAYGFGGNRMVSLIVSGLIVSMIISIVFFIFFGLTIGTFALLIGLASTAQQGAGGALTAIISIPTLLIGILLTILIVLLLVVGFLFVSQAIVLEGYGPIGALKRSVQLVRVSFWRVLGIVILLYVLIQVVTLIPTMIFGGAVGFIFHDPIKDFAIRESLSALVGYTAQILVLPMLISGYTILYYDLRVRKEGYDIELQVQENLSL